MINETSHYASDFLVPTPSSSRSRHGRVLMVSDSWLIIVIIILVVVALIQLES